MGRVDDQLKIRQYMKLISYVIRLILVATLIALTGCASTPMANKEQEAVSKAFKAPPPGLASVYIYRNSNFGAAIKKRVSIDNTLIGSTASYTFFHIEVTPSAHTLTTQAEFGDNELQFNAEAGKSYFFHQYIKFGTFVGSANIESVNEEEGKKGVLACGEAYQVFTVNNPAPVGQGKSQSDQSSNAPQQLVAQAPANTALNTPPPANGTTSQKLRELQSLRNDGIISEDEFQKKKKQLLESL